MNDWKLWLDDQMNDPDAPSRHVPEGYVGAESTQQAVDLIKEKGVPYAMDLDHDLSNGDDAMIFLQWLFRYHPNTPPLWLVHSENPEGRKNIDSYMSSWHRSMSMP